MPMSDAPCSDTLPLLKDHVRYLFSTEKICRAQNFGVMGFMHLLTQMNGYHRRHTDALTYACWPPTISFLLHPTSFHLSLRAPYHTYGAVADIGGAPYESYMPPGGMAPAFTAASVG